MPIYVEPITDTIAHKIPDCDNNFDYYCMWKPGPLKVATTLAPLSMKPCLVKSPKLNDFPSKFFQSSVVDQLSKPSDTWKMLSLPLLLSHFS